MSDKPTTTYERLTNLAYEELQARFRDLGPNEGYERQILIRLLNLSRPPSDPPGPAKPNPVKQGLLDAQMDWIDSL